MRIPLLLFVMLPCSAFAASVKDDASALATCVEARDEKACAARVTESSKPLFTKVTGYKLMDCLPESMSYLSHTTKKSISRVAMRAAVSGSEYRVLLSFRKEGESYKLDLPDTLLQGLGKEWKARVDTTEKLYLFLKSQLGDKLNCDSIRALVQQDPSA